MDNLEDNVPHYGDVIEPYRSNNKDMARKQNVQPHFQLKRIKPLTTNQSKVFEAYDQGKNIVMHGFAGTGKSYIALGLALKQVINNPTEYDKVLIIRSAVPSRDMGYLPGGDKEKAKVYEEPYKQICKDLFERGDGYEILKIKKILDFMTTSYLRGLTFDHSIVIVDEINNMSYAELCTIITRLGEGSKIIFCGDFRQSDFRTDIEKQGLKDFLSILKKMNGFSYHEFGVDDIVRSGLVKNFIIKKAEFEDGQVAIHEKTY